MSRVRLGFEFALLFLITIAARLMFIQNEPIHDELYHLIAAYSWIENGSFAIADGEYTRSKLYTVFVGLIYEFFGDDVTTLRISSAFVGSIWVLAVFAWCRYRFDRSVAWIAALLFGFAPGAIFLSQYVRFYVLHGLLFWLAAIGTFELLERRFTPVTRALLIAAVLVCFAGAIHLQLTTLVGVAGIALFLAFWVLPDLFRRSAQSPIFRQTLIGLAAAAILGMVGLVSSGIAYDIFEIYRWAPAWASKTGFLTYHWILVDQFPVIWATLPIVSLLVVRRKSAAGTYCVMIFGSAVVLHSFAGMKVERFIFYVLPFFFILGAVFLKEGLALAGELISQIFSDTLRRRHRLLEIVQVAVVSVVGIFLVLSNPAFRATADMLRGQPVNAGNSSAQYWSRYDTTWNQAAPMLKELADQSEIVLSSNELHMLYFVGRLDIELNFSRLSELISGEWDQSDEFKSDFRTGRPVISSAESVRRVVSCHASGLIVVRAASWLNQATIPAETRGVIEAITERVEIPDKWGLRIYKWMKEGAGSSIECASLMNGRTASTRQKRQKRTSK
jgi:4-amino-4-deoxy-L-arabinose transferase-like glycosyltransferase